MPKNYNVYEGSGKTVHSELESNKSINEGDTITYQSNNQQGYEKYRVILNKKGKKTLKLIDSYDHQIGVYDYDDDDESKSSTPSPASRTRSRSSSRTPSKKGGKPRKTIKRRKTNRRKN
jgi:hypothetical protein